MHYFLNQNSLFDLENGLNVSIISRMYFFIWEYDFFILENHFLILENDFRISENLCCFLENHHVFLGV